MSLDVEKLTQVVESLGCAIKKVGFRELYVMMPINFPWYGKGYVQHCDNSRIIAAATLTIGTWDWTDAWTIPDIHIENGKPLGIEMRRKGLYIAGGTLRSFNYEELADWLTEKIGEVSNKAKEFHKMVLTLEREKCLNNLS